MTSHANGFIVDHQSFILSTLITIQYEIEEYSHCQTKKMAVFSQYRWTVTSRMIIMINHIQFREVKLFSSQARKILN